MKASGCTFDEFLPLLPAEEKLREACRNGTWAGISNKTPEHRVEDQVIRAEFVRFLALGGDESAPIHAKGIQLIGAYIEGPLDLQACTILVPLWLTSSRFDSEIVLRDAVIKGLYLSGSAVVGIRGDRMRCQGGVFLRHDFKSDGPIWLQGAEIGGTLDCIRANFGKDSELIATSINIKGRFIWKEIKADDMKVSLVGSRAGALSDDPESWRQVKDLSLDGFCYDRISNARTDARFRAEWLRQGIKGDLLPQPWEQVVKVLREMGHPEDAKLLAIAKQKEMLKRGLIGGYQKSQDLSFPMNVLSVLWIELLNKSSRLLHRIYGGLAGYGYRPMRTVIWLIGAWLICAGAYLLAERDGYFGPVHPLYQTNNQFKSCGAPGERDVQPWTRCDALPIEHTKLNPLIYSLDVILPVVDLRQETEWSPIVPDGYGIRAWAGSAIRVLMWVQILFGWITSLLLVSALGRLVQKD